MVENEKYFLNMLFLGGKKLHPTTKVHFAGLLWEVDRIWR